MIQLQEQEYKQLVQLVSDKQATEDVKMNKHAHLIFYSIANADFVLTIHKKGASSSQAETAYFHAYNDTLIYTYQYDGTYQVCWLPHIPMVIGGISSFLKKSVEQNTLIEIEGKIKEEKESDFTLTIQEKSSPDIETIHSITHWFVYQYSNCAKERSANE